MSFLQISYYIYDNCNGMIIKITYILSATNKEDKIKTTTIM